MVAYWQSYVAYSGRVMVAKSMQGSYYDLQGHFNYSSKSAKAWTRLLTSQVQPCRWYWWSNYGHGRHMESRSNAPVIPISCFICATVVHRTWWSWSAYRARDQSERPWSDGSAMILQDQEHWKDWQNDRQCDLGFKATTRCFPSMFLKKISDW